MLNPGRQADLADLHAQLIAYAVRVEELPSPEQVLNELHAVTYRHLPLQVMEAARFPLKSGDWDAVQARKIGFLHKVFPTPGCQELGLGEETIRSHLKKAQIKLGVRNRAQAVAEALRQHLIP